jgi:hypothetical protein
MTEKRYQFRGGAAVGTVIKKLFEEPSALNGKGQAGWLVRDADPGGLEQPRLALRYMSGRYVDDCDSSTDIIEVPTFKIENLGLYETAGGEVAYVNELDNRAYGRIVSGDRAQCWNLDGTSWHDHSNHALVKFLGTFKQAAQALADNQRACRP